MFKVTWWQCREKAKRIRNERQRDLIWRLCCCSVAKSCLTLWHHGRQHTRLFSPSLSPRVCSDSCPLSEGCCLTVSQSSAALFSCLQSCPASGSFPMSQLFVSGEQRISASASASIPPVNVQGWFLLRLNGLISLQSKGLARVFCTHAYSVASVMSDSLCPYRL